MAGLSIQSEGGEEKFALEAGTVTLGRGLESDVRLRDIKASRRHCQVVKTDEGYKLLDLSSGNGTYVNGILVEREQPLHDGDRIQIGTTVIAFADGGPAAGGKVPTRLTRATEAEQKQAQKPTSRVASLSPQSTKTMKGPGPQTAVTKKLETTGTTRATVKLGPATPRLGTAVKPPTSIASATGRVTTRRGTGKTPTTTATAATHRTSRTSMTERFTKEAGKKKVNPLILVIAGGVAVLAIIIGVILFSGSGGDEAVGDATRVTALQGEAAKLIDQGKYDEAIAKYREAIKICEKHPKELGTQKNASQGFIQEAEGYKKDREDARVKWETIQAEFKENKYVVKEMLNKAKQTRESHRALKMPWTLPEGAGEIDVVVQTLERQREEEISSGKRERFQAARQDIIDRFKLARKAEEDFAGAFRAWEEYEASTKDSEGKNKAPNERQGVLRDAFGASRDLIRKIEGMEKSDGIKALEDALPRFAGLKFDNGEKVADIEKDLRDKLEELKK